ncbi:Hypothetical protein NTJ_12651 [Nesidiocoris tenuis]|uniref:Uncharacterized protein n=1 Tax=Nesidiocoris tenuis TaxID=355587 RepID=A0ABN7B6F0_9HEMI|nr:Hypothetical protein NTJ_12651 [Nesidiocoris tenuis]
MPNFDTKNIVALAREFDEKLEALRSGVCEPSKLGAGLKTVSAMNSIEEKARRLLDEVNELNETMNARLLEKEQRSNSMAEVLKELEEKLDEIDGK